MNNKFSNDESALLIACIINNYKIAKKHADLAKNNAIFIETALFNNNKQIAEMLFENNSLINTNIISLTLRKNMKDLALKMYLKHNVI
jgi:hypothetical protein